MAIKYKVITDGDETQALGRKFVWKKMDQEALKEAYDLGLTSFVEKIEDKVKAKKVKKDEK